MDKKLNIALQIGFVASLIINTFLIGFIWGGQRSSRPPPLSRPISTLIYCGERT